MSSFFDNLLIFFDVFFDIIFDIFGNEFAIYLFYLIKDASILIKVAKN